VGSGTYFNPISGVGNGAVTYLSSDACATVNATTGVVSLVRAGTATIQATRAGTATFATVYNTYTLTVQGIGTHAGGGIIGYILEPGDPGYVAGVPHGLIAAITDATGFFVWALPAYQSTTVPGGAIGTAIGTGMANSNAIVLQNGAVNSYAAGVCDVSTNPDTGTGVFSDWYLPNEGELVSLYQSRLLIGNFSNDLYWSSQEFTATTASCLNFANSTVVQSPKSNSYRVRAVRSF